MNRLKIMIDGNILSRGLVKDTKRSGIYFMAYNLVNELIRSNSVDICFFVNKDQSELINSMKSDWQNYNIDFYLYSPLNLYRFSQYFQKNRLLSKILSFYLNYQKKRQNINMNNYIKEKGYSVFLSLVSRLPGVIKNTSLKKFTILYDIIPLLTDSFYKKTDFYLKKDMWNWWNDMFNSINFNDYYLAISQHTRRDFIKYSRDIDPDKVFVTYLPCSDFFVPSKLSDEIRNKYGIPTDKKFIFSLFNIEPRKNFVMAINAFIEFVKKNEIEDLCFVIGGASCEYTNSWINKVIPAAKNNPNIIMTGYIDDEDLSSLYSSSEWFVYTSKYEGFGLPPLEAMRCGCPVIVSNSTSLPEVVGDAGIQVDCDDLQQHVSAYERYYFNREFREESISKGFIQAKTFSWQKTVDDVIRIMNSVCNES